MENKNDDHKLTPAQKANKEYWEKELSEQRVKKVGRRGKVWDWRTQGNIKESPHYLTIKANRDRRVAEERKLAGRMGDLVETESIEADTIYDVDIPEDDDLGDEGKSLEDLAKDRSSYNPKKGRKNAKTKKTDG